MMEIFNAKDGVNIMQMSEVQRSILLYFLNSFSDHGHRGTKNILERNGKTRKMYALLKVSILSNVSKTGYDVRRQTLV